MEGKIRSRSWDDQNGQKRYVTEIQADTIQLLGRRADGPSAGAPAQPANSGGSNAAPNPPAPPPPAPPTPAAVPAAASAHDPDGQSR